MAEENEQNDDQGDEQKPAPKPRKPRAWNEGYQADVASRLRAIRDELAAVEDAALVRRDLDTVLRRLPS